MGIIIIIYVQIQCSFTQKYRTSTIQANECEKCVYRRFAHSQSTLHTAFCIHFNCTQRWCASEQWCAVVNSIIHRSDATLVLFQFLISFQCVDDLSSPSDIQWPPSCGEQMLTTNENKYIRLKLILPMAVPNINIWPTTRINMKKK